jgi:hypothetical protein
MFIFNPDPFLLPSYRISPFKTDSIAFNHLLANDDFSITYFNNKFGINNWSFIVNGREGINIALRQYNLLPDDVVTILTTTQNFYVSSCVTKEIEKFCKWNREITNDTKVIFVNHEFGYPYPDMEKLKLLGVPIIEDCCTTFFSQDSNGKVGFYGDFTVYSFPKFFSIQVGGLIIKNNTNLNIIGTAISDAEVNYITNILSYYLKDENILLNSRRIIYKYAENKFSKHGFTPRLLTEECVFPTSYLFNNHGLINDLPGLKIYLSNHGIQSSVFYGEDAFFVPCHQNMYTTDIDYILSCILRFKTDL